MSRYTKRRREEDGGLMTEEEKMRRFMEEAEEEEGKDVESIPMTAKQKEEYIASMLASKRAKAADGFRYHEFGLIPKTFASRQTSIEIRPYTSTAVQPTSCPIG